MTDTDEGSGTEPVGSVAEEAAKLMGALSEWAREHGDGLSGISGSVAGAAHSFNEHFATGGEDCTYCPICRGVHFVRTTSPEVKAHLASAAASLLQAAAGLMAAQVPADGARRTTGVEHIDLDADAGDWPQEDE